MKDDILSRLAEDTASSSKRKRSIVDYIQENCDKAAFMTAEMLANATGVSESTVVRFATELGYDGYPGMRKALQQILRSKLEADRLEESDAVPTATMKIFRSSMDASKESIKQAANAKNEQCLDAMLSILLSAREVYILACDELRPLTEYLEGALGFLRGGLRTVSDNIFKDLYYIENCDTLLVLTGTECVKTAAAAHFAQDRGARVIGICNKESSAVLKYADFALCAEGGAAVYALISAIISAAEVLCERSLVEAKIELENIRTEYEEYEKQRD